jgi:transposase-like protein
MNISEVREKFSTEQDAIKYFEQIRWGGQPQCPYCGSPRLSKHLTDFRFKCYGCYSTISVTVGTYLHGTNVNLQNWLRAFSVISNAEKNVTAGALKKQLEVSYSTAWKIYCVIRDLIEPEYKDGSIIAAIAERTSIGGLRNRLKWCQSTIERYIRIKSKNTIVLSMGKPKDNLKFSKIMGYLAKADSIFFMIRGVDDDLIKSFWAMIERRIRARYDTIYLTNLRKYILEAVFEIGLKMDINMFEILSINSMKEKEYKKRIKDNGWW